MVNARPIRRLMERTLGISSKRSLPKYANERFDKWFAKKRVGTSRSDVRTVRALHGESSTGLALQRGVPARGKVILWDDTFARYHEPEIGIAAVKVLEALGFEVELLENRKCCGRPAFSQGNLDAAAKLGQHNIDLLMASQPLNSASQPPVRLAPQLSTLSCQLPIVFLEPSCWSMFAEDYRELKIPNAEKIAAHCFLFEKFVDDLLTREPEALPVRNLNGQVPDQPGAESDRPLKVAIHAHCHAKSILNPAFMARLVERLPGRKSKLLDTGCCGMAGAFGALAEKYDLSVQVAADLLKKVETENPDVVVASGTSCRHQIADLTDLRPLHMAELIAEAIV